jgi:putative FmdB family regulatory protein
MPLYEYFCAECGEDFEKMVRFSEAGNQPECPSCHGSNTHKKISLFASTGNAGSSSFSPAGSSCGSSGGFS